MSEKTESKLIYNMELLTARVAELGAAYTPPNPIAELSNLQHLLAAVKAKREAWQAAEAQEETGRNTREDLLRGLLPFFGETIVYGRSLRLDKNDLEALTSVNRVIQGRPAPSSGKRMPETGETEPPARKRSVARTSFASRADKASEFLELLRANPAYRPTDDKFSLATIETNVGALHNSNTEVGRLEASTQNLRTELDDLLYLAEECLINAAESARFYIKSRFTTRHPIWQQIKKLRFDKPNRLRKAVR
ncbi:MAG: hypothetical protein JSS81_12040 [Acidobacteria bacterium]|nr:hypothetical protein [Acidobacteriota bacterium]